MASYSDQPPSYDSVMAQTPSMMSFEGLHVPPRYRSASQGRNSIRYDPFSPLQDTTKIYLVDNKAADITSLNYQNDHSQFMTTVVQNSDYTPMEAATQTINLDERSNWGGEFRTILHSNMPNCTEYMFSNSFRVKLMSAKKDGVPSYEWFDLTIPEGNYTDAKVIDLMNCAIVDNYLNVGRQNGVLEEDIGVKIDTRNFRLGYDPVTGLVMPGRYTYEAFHPDIVLLPGCAIDFTRSRLSNFLGIRKRLPFQAGFIIDYDMLRGGNIPALLDVSKYAPGTTALAEPVVDIQPLLRDSEGRSYHVIDPENGGTDTAYRSWYLAYNYGPADGVRATTLLTNPDITGGVEQVYWSLPDMAQNPVTFKSSQNPTNLPVVATEMMPLQARNFANPLACYSQMVEGTTNQTAVYNRFPENQILIRAPASAITCISENVPTVTNHGTVGLKNTIPGVQRVVLNDARRRTCPYITKALAIIEPRVLSSKTF